jgi:hypothetical protein
MLIFKIGPGVCRFLFGLETQPIHHLCITKDKSLSNCLTYKTKHRKSSIDTHFWNGAGTVSHSLLLWNMANTAFMIICIQLPPRLLIMQDQKLLMHRWLSCSGLGKNHVCLVFRYKGGRFIWKRQWLLKVNILQLAVGYLNATINWKTQNPKPENGTDRYRQTRHNLRIDGYGSGFGLPRWFRLGCWTVRELNQKVFSVPTWTAARISGPVGNTSAHCGYS